MPVLSEIFRDCPQVKILETFAENYNDTLYAADIIRLTDVSKITVNKYITNLLKEGIIERKEKEGRIQFYQLNMNNPKAKVIQRIEEFIASEKLGDLIRKDAVTNMGDTALDIKCSIRTGKSTDNLNSIKSIPPSLQTPNYNKVCEVKTSSGLIIQVGAKINERGEPA